jgi:hypothetical protein
LPAPRSTGSSPAPPARAGTYVVDNNTVVASTAITSQSAIETQVDCEVGRRGRRAHQDLAHVVTLTSRAGRKPAALPSVITIARRLLGAPFFFERHSEMNLLEARSSFSPEQAPVRNARRRVLPDVTQFIPDGWGEDIGLAMDAQPRLTPRRTAAFPVGSPP